MEPLVHSNRLWSGTTIFIFGNLAQQFYLLNQEFLWQARARNKNRTLIFKYSPILPKSVGPAEVSLTETLRDKKQALVKVRRRCKIMSSFLYYSDILLWYEMSRRVDGEEKRHVRNKKSVRLNWAFHISSKYCRTIFQNMADTCTTMGIKTERIEIKRNNPHCLQFEWCEIRNDSMHPSENVRWENFGKKFAEEPMSMLNAAVKIQSVASVRSLF